MTQTLQEKQKTAFDALSETQGYENKMEVPQLKKVIITTGIGSVSDPEKIELIRDRLAKITGQKPVATKAKHSIAAFSTREGDVIGYKVTLRGEQMRNFIDKLIHLTLPRTKDFRGISRDTIDEMGNITIGVSEHTAFPETSDEELKNVFGLGVTIVTTTNDKQVAEGYLEHIGIPFQKREESVE
ncbi:MAG: 50S ribosomal protein L5 [Candidatus Paceibacterota bacterium]